MSFLRSLFGLRNKLYTMLPIERSKYANWTQEQLIERLLELEGQRNVSGDKRALVLSEIESKNSKKQKKAKKFDFSKYNVRYIALKFAYLGWNYNGLAIQKQPTPLPTVEGTIIEALNKCRLVPSTNPLEFKFSRCGRTDKGVSAMSQVISLNVRSNFEQKEQEDPENDDKEVQYVHILNQVLPDDIRISAVCLRPPKNFDARFSCQQRHYRYLFHKDCLNIFKMEQAASLYVGDHDFRNFCKLDGSKQITNFNRTMISSKILKLSRDFYCFDLVGSAFLWHQVRCMMAILFLVGQELEEPQLIINMLDVKLTPQKPIYDMASDVPLILYDCNFESMEWRRSNLNDYKSIKYEKAVNALALNYEIKSEVSRNFKEMLSFDLKPEIDLLGKTRINIGDGKGKVVTKYVKVSERGVMVTAESVNEKFRLRKKAKTLNKV